MLVRLLGFMMVLALVASAHAQDAPAKTGPALNWTRQPGAESCIASVELAARIEARVKRKIFVAAPEAIVAVEGYVAPDPNGGFRASIAMSDGQGALYGSRELTTQGACSELTDGLVFVIAVTLRPEGGASGIELPESVASALDALFGAEPTEPDPEAFPPSQPAPAPAAVVEPEAQEPTVAKPADDGPGLVFYLEVLGAAQLGLQPTGSLGGGLGARLRIQSVGSVSLHGVLFVPTDRTVDDLNSERISNATFTVRVASLGYCTPALWQSTALRLEGCASGRVGSITGKGTAFSDENAGSSVFGSVGLAARLAWRPSSPLSIGLAVGPELHLGRPEFIYLSESAAGDLETAEVYRTTLVGAAAELSVGFALF